VSVIMTLVVVHSKMVVPKATLIATTAVSVMHIIGVKEMRKNEDQVLQLPDCDRDSQRRT